MSNDTNPTCLRSLTPSRGLTRRSLVALASAMAVHPFGFAQQQSQQGMTPQQRMLIESLPVLPWLSIGETKKNEVRGPIQQAISSHRGAVMLTDGTTPDTNGYFINLASSSKFGLLGIDGCQMAKFEFGSNERAQLVWLSIDRGWKDKFIKPTISALANRYASIVEPVYLRDGDSEATDTTVLWDIGRFVIEAVIPQHSTMFNVTFTTKDILRKLRTIDRTVEPLRPYLDGTAQFKSREQ